MQNGEERASGGRINPSPRPIPNPNFGGSSGTRSNPIPRPEPTPNTSKGK